MPASISVFLNDHDRGKLEILLQSGKTEQPLVRRIVMVMTFAEGLRVKRVVWLRPGIKFRQELCGPNLWGGPLVSCPSNSLHNLAACMLTHWAFHSAGYLRDTTLGSIGGEETCSGRGNIEIGARTWTGWRRVSHFPGTEPFSWYAHPHSHESTVGLDGVNPSGESKKFTPTHFLEQQFWRCPCA